MDQPKFVATNRDQPKFVATSPLWFFHDKQLRLPQSSLHRRCSFSEPLVAAAVDQ